MKLWAYHANSMLWASKMAEWTPDHESFVDGDGSPSGPYVLVSDLGFTREDVRLCQDQIVRSGHAYGDNPKWYSLIERIAALLPPEVK